MTQPTTAECQLWLESELLKFDDLPPQSQAEVNHANILIALGKQLSAALEMAKALEGFGVINWKCELDEEGFCYKHTGNGKPCAYEDGFKALTAYRKASEQ